MCDLAAEKALSLFREGFVRLVCTVSTTQLQGGVRHL